MSSKAEVVEYTLSKINALLSEKFTKLGLFPGSQKQPNKRENTLNDESTKIAKDQYAVIPARRQVPPGVKTGPGVHSLTVSQVENCFNSSW